MLSGWPQSPCSSLLPCLRQFWSKPLTSESPCRRIGGGTEWRSAFWRGCKLQALVYDILPSTTAVFSYAIGSRKLSANEQCSVGAQTVVHLLQTTQIISDVCFITDHVAYTSSNKTKIVSIKTKLPFFSFLPGVDTPHV